MYIYIYMYKHIYIYGERERENRVLLIDVQSESKVEHLKQAIFRTLGVPEFAQKLLVNDMHLSSGELRNNRQFPISIEEC